MARAGRGDHGAATGQGEFGLTALVAPETPSGAVVYVFHDLKDVRRSIPEADVAAWREQHGGAWPKFVRVAAMRNGRWGHIATQVVHFRDDAAWIQLEVRVDGDRLGILVDGARCAPVRCPRALDGRVGLAKWYDTTARFRGWRLDAAR